MRPEEQEDAGLFQLKCNRLDKPIPWPQAVTRPPNLQPGRPQSANDLRGLDLIPGGEAHEHPAVFARSARRRLDRGPAVEQLSDCRPKRRWRHGALLEERVDVVTQPEYLCSGEVQCSNTEDRHITIALTNLLAERLARKVEDPLIEAKIQDDQTVRLVAKV